MLYDFHCHILPGVDDGSRSTQQSVAMLDSLRSSGVKAVVATPHFYYSRTTLDNFLAKRDTAYEKLVSAIKNQDYPIILKGAEVLLTTDIPHLDNLEKLCIQGTQYILIELPYSYWSSWVYKSLDEISARGLTPIIAHIDRYTEASDEAVERIFYSDCLVQINLDSIIDKRSRKKAFKYIKGGNIHLLGSDAHNDTGRPPRFGEAMEILKKKFGNEIEPMFERNSLYVLRSKE